MSGDRDHSPDRPLGSTLGPDIAAHVEGIVRAAEREARAAERAIEDRRRSAEEEVQRYLAAARLHVDAETAARAARLEALSSAARRLADELSDAAAALTMEMRREDAAVPRAPWPSPPREPVAAPPPPARAPELPDDPFPPRTPASAASDELPNAARLVAIEMAVGGSSRAEVAAHLLAQFGIAEPAPLLDDVFGSESQATSRLAWGEP
jgi:hypothetical protein